jgi:predicted Zn-dependent protease
MLRKARWYLLAAVLVACGVEGTSFLISDAQESDLGAEVHQEVLAEYPPFNDAQVSSWVENVGQRLATASQSERDGVNYQFFVLDTEIVNAFAVPGGYVYLTRGLINTADSEAEVASVLGHEVGHVAHRHSVAAIERAAAAGIIADLVFGDGIGSDVINFATNFVLSTSYSRDQETDADDQGVVYTYQAGYNPYGMVDFFEKLDALAGPNPMPDWLSSHPQPLDRARRAEQNILAIDPTLTRQTAESRTAWEMSGTFGQVQQILLGGQTPVE